MKKLNQSEVNSLVKFAQMYNTTLWADPNWSPEYNSIVAFWFVYEARERFNLRSLHCTVVNGKITTMEYNLSPFIGDEVSIIL